MEVKKERQTQFALQWSTSLKPLLLLSIFLSSLFLLSQVKISVYFPIKIVRVYGLNQVDKDEVQKLVKPLVSEGFFAVNLEYIRERLLQLPWVSDTFIRRAWPDKVEIMLIEKTPAANWNNQNLLSVTGELFTPHEKNAPNQLPNFFGPQGQQILMLHCYTDLNQILAPLHLKITTLELTPFFTWNLILTNGITLHVGHKDILTRVSHFVRVYPKIIGNRAADVAYVDLRYSAGMAVKWKEPINT